ncbi:hypothetical protein P4597_07700 [Peribacillus simplex]|uniref:hypothetical protein n=1 Tax=Peribacillus simplex TaxID=1478 RepID=UPI002E23B9F3|nr:hypothetical protein [Peribacillus simplex]
MAYYIYNGKKHSISNLKNMEKRCSCNADYYTFIENPINIQLKKGKEPTVFKSTTKEPVKESYTRAISFKGCICELDKISKSYSIKGALIPTQYNWSTIEFNKETGKRCMGKLRAERYFKWHTNWKKV